MLKLAVFVALAMLVQCEAKQFDLCGLVRELRRQGFPEDKMRDWVCLVENESARHTDMTHSHRIGSRTITKDYGLFQINDKSWCSNTGSPGKNCNVTCADLLTDDITKASKCAKEIFKRYNFLAWYGWKNHCRPTSLLPDISSC